MKEPKDYIIFPLDVPNFNQAMTFVHLLKDHVGMFKVGLELFISQGPSILKAIRNETGSRIFLDLKLHDIPATSTRAFLAACEHGPEFVTVHCDEGNTILKDVAEKNPGNTKILAVTILTSLNGFNLSNLGYRDEFAENLSGLALLKAQIAVEAGCHGVVCSGHEVAGIKKALGQDLIVVTPGIRPAWSVVGSDDQKRVMTPQKAVKAGADYLVIGRPIRDADDPKSASQKIAEEIESAL